MRVALFLFLFPLSVLAQPFPTRAITIEGVAVIVENLPGAGGNVGARAD